jgi:hypothetical protein
MSMFSAGDAYERFMGRWSRRLAPLVVRFAGSDGDAVLDISSGALTAAVAAALATASSGSIRLSRSWRSPRLGIQAT